MRSLSNYSFARVPSIHLPRSVFKRDRTLKTTLNAGFLVPFYWDEVYAGDTFNVQSTLFGRMTTPIAPLMDNLYLDTFYFYVPYRLLWKHWNNMLGEQENPGDSIDYLCPIMCNTDESNVKRIASGSLADYLGFPVGQFGSKGLDINAFLFRAYNKIWNDHFRDENLQDSVYFDTGDGPDDLANYTLLRRGKRKDYFTSCLPWPQKGPGAEISIGGRANVYGDGNPLEFINRGSSETTPAKRMIAIGTHSSAAKSGNAMFAGCSDNDNLVQLDTAISGYSAFGFPTRDEITDTSLHPFQTSTGLYADLSAATPISINDMRMAFQLQKFMEQDARAGTRATELIFSHFGVVCPDFRLQRSEFLGGGEIPINIHQVVQTSNGVSQAGDTTDVLGGTGAYAVMAGRSGFSKSFVEHGVVLGLCSIRADITYSQGIERSWSRRSRFDFYWPEFAHLGEQAVLNKEIFAQGTSEDDAAFGYQERWAELRYGMSHLTGLMRPNLSLSPGQVWTVSDFYQELPKLNGDWIQDNPPVDRVLAISSQGQVNSNQFMLDTLTHCKCARPMPVYSVPGLIDHPV